MPTAIVGLLADHILPSASVNALGPGAGDGLVHRYILINQTVSFLADAERLLLALERTPYVALVVAPIEHGHRRDMGIGVKNIGAVVVLRPEVIVKL